MILILTDKNDVHADVVIKKLKTERVEVLRLNLDVISLEKTFITFENSIWRVKNEINEFTSKDISCVWNRKTFVQLMLDEQNKGYEFNIWKNEWNKALLGFYYSIREISWLNYYRENHKAENKYLQVDLANKLGFNIPKSLLSNEKNRLLDFSKQNEKIVLKLMNQDFYKIQDNEFKGFYVNILSSEHLMEFCETEENPIFVQEYIEKQFEVRYTVIDNEHFVCKIDSQKSDKSKVDWRRYDLANTPHSIIEAPPEIKTKVANLLKGLNLHYGALDFIITPNNEWYFLEINPSGQFLWIEDLTGLNISASIAKWLILHSK